MRRLQTLYHQFERKEIDVTSKDARTRRIAWASEQIGRAIKSFSALTLREADTLIETLHGVLGVASTKPSRRLGRERAFAAGTEGRRGYGSGTVTLASKEDIERIRDAVHRLGWDEARLTAFLSSPSSPLKNKSNPQIKTLAQANQVWWALKKMLKAKGLWL